MDWWRASTSMRCGLAAFGSRVLVRSVPAAWPLKYLLTYLLDMDMDMVSHMWREALEL